MGENPRTSTRLYSLDILRGLTVAAMIVVNNAGGKQSYAQLQHSAWNGLTLCDMVFPTFLFIVGITTYVSLRKHIESDQEATLWPVIKHILRRSLYILLIGWAIHWLGHALKGELLPVQTFRLTGVLPRIAACYLIVSLLALWCRQRTIHVIIGVLLVGYGALLLLGQGYENSLDNLLVQIDRWLVGAGHLYSKQPVDPEGIASLPGCVAHTLIGYCFGRLIFDKSRPLNDRLLTTMVWGFGLLLCGLLLEGVLPCNKRVWSPTFTLDSCGLAALALGLISYITDIQGEKKIFQPFDVFGVNPLALYALSEVAAIVISAFGAKSVAYGWIFSLVPEPYVASAIYSLIFVSVMWMVGYPLYRNKIYIKI